MIPKLVSTALSYVWGSFKANAHIVGTVLGGCAVVALVGTVVTRELHRKSDDGKISEPPSANAAIARADLAALRSAQSERDQLQHDLATLQAHYDADRAAWAAREASYQAQIADMDPARAASIFTDFNRELSSGRPDAGR